MGEIFLSIIIPCYNEEKNLRLGALKKVSKYLAGQKYSWEVIVVDDGSTDASLSLIQKFTKVHPGFSLIKNPHQGKAVTVITGMLAARGEVVLFTDMDQATPMEEIDKFLPYFKQGFDIVIGSRAERRVGAPFSRLIMAKGFMFLRNLFLSLPIADTQCGFKALKREVAQKLFQKMKLYRERRKVVGSHVTAGFDVELLFLAKRAGFKIKEVPVVWRYVETRRVNPIKDSWYGFLDLVKIRLNSLRGLYE